MRVVFRTHGPIGAHILCLRMYFLGPFACLNIHVTSYLKKWNSSHPIYCDTFIPGDFWRQFVIYRMPYTTIVYCCRFVLATETGEEFMQQIIFIHVTFVIKSARCHLSAVMARVMLCVYQIKIMMLWWVMYRRFTLYYCFVKTWVQMIAVAKGIKNGCPCIVEIRGTQGCALETLHEP